MKISILRLDFQNLTLGLHGQIKPVGVLCSQATTHLQMNRGIQPPRMQTTPKEPSCPWMFSDTVMENRLVKKRHSENMQTRKFYIGFM